MAVLVDRIEDVRDAIGDRDKLPDDDAERETESDRLALGLLDRVATEDADGDFDTDIDEVAVLVDPREVVRDASGDRDSLESAVSVASSVAVGSLSLLS